MLCAVLAVQVNTQHFPTMQQCLSGRGNPQPELVIAGGLHPRIEQAIDVVQRTAPHRHGANETDLHKLVKAPLGEAEQPGAPGVLETAHKRFYGVEVGISHRPSIGVQRPGKRLKGVWGKSVVCVGVGDVFAVGCLNAKIPRCIDGRYIGRRQQNIGKRPCYQMLEAVSLANNDDLREQGLLLEVQQSPLQELGAVIGAYDGAYLRPISVECVSQRVPNW